MSRARQHLPFLQLLKQTHLKQRKELLNTASSEQIKFLSEIVLNLLQGNIPITKRQKKILVPYEKIFIELSDRKNSIKKLRKLWICASKNIIPILLKEVLQLLT